MNIILNEKKYAEEIIKNDIVSKKSSETIQMLAKYYFSQGKKKKEFDHVSYKDLEFDYSILKSNTDYSKNTYDKIYELYQEYNQLIQEYKIKHSEHDDLSSYRNIKFTEFKKECEIICPNEDELRDIVLDICYQNNNTKQFAWDMCGETFIQNLLKLNDNKINYPELDSQGEIYFGGNRFTMKQKELEDTD